MAKRLDKSHNLVGLLVRRGRSVGTIIGAWTHRGQTHIKITYGSGEEEDITEKDAMALVAQFQAPTRRVSSSNSPSKTPPGSLRRRTKSPAAKRRSKSPAAKRSRKKTPAKKEQPVLESAPPVDDLSDDLDAEGVVDWEEREGVTLAEIMQTIDEEDAVAEQASAQANQAINDVVAQGFIIVRREVVMLGSALVFGAGMALGHFCWP